MQLDEADARLFVSASTDRSTCAWAGDGPSAADVVAHAGERDLASHHLSTLGEERHARAVARAIVRARGDAADRYDARAGRDRRARRARARQRDPSGDADVPGAAHFRQRRARRTGAADSLAAERVLKPGGPACRGRVPFARGPHRQEFPRPSAAARRPLSRHQPEIAAAPPTFRVADAPAGNARTKPRSPPIRARVRQSCAPPSAPTLRAREAAIETLLPRLPSLADVMRGRP